MVVQSDSTIKLPEHFLIWDTASMAWTEIGLDATEYQDRAKRLWMHYPDWQTIDRIILRDVLGSFAFESGLLPLAIVPVLGFVLMTLLPDWGYNQDYLIGRMQRWYGRPIWVHYLNPFRVIGYPIGYWMAFSLRRKLKLAFEHEMRQSRI